MKPLVIGNFKMNPASLAKASELMRRIAAGISGQRGVEVLIAPPFPYLAAGRGMGRKAGLAAQDVFWENAGAYTGEVSPLMLRDLGVRAVIVGHSERRRILGETDEMVNKKVRAVLKARLMPIIAIGEESREAEDVVPPVLFEQLSRALAIIPKQQLRGIAVAYEPVWAIGTGRADTADNAARRAIYIRKLLTKILGVRVANTIRVLYGGSVTSKNAASFISRDIRGMEGLLVGGASLDADEFVKIAESVAVGRQR